MSFTINQFLVFVGAAVVMVPIFNRLGFGSVLGYLIAGLIVGPYGFSLIKEPENVLHFAELGVVLLLFVIGLEIQPVKLWSMRKSLLGLGGFQVFGSTAIFMGGALLFGLPLTSAIVIGFALSLSSTAFALQTLMERNQLNTEFGRSSFSILLMQDLVAIPALALIPALGTSSTHGPSPFDLGMFLVIVVGLVIASRFVIRPVFRMITATRSREIFTAATLFIVLGVAGLMQKVGLSAALGTFMAGVLLADSEYRHELEADLEPFKSLLMGLFFVAVGMGVDLVMIMKNPLLVFSLAIGYLFIKWLIIYTGGRLFKMSHDDSKMMALSIGQGGEFAFVIFGMALSFNLAPSENITLLTAVVTLSMALSPLFNLLNERIADKWGVSVEPKYDEIKNESPEVIIAGFGRFGQIIGRALRAQKIPFVAIDHDSDQIELLRKFGNKVYYGDASRLDLLKAAGADRAKYFILAIDDVEASVETAKILIEHFPNLKVFARARNRGHVFDLWDLGIRHIKRETFESSVLFVRDLLVEMGHEPEKALTIIQKFKQHDEIMMKEQYKVRKDDKMFVSVSKQSIAQLAEVLNNESSQSYIDFSGEKNQN